MLYAPRENSLYFQDDFNAIFRFELQTSTPERIFTIPEQSTFKNYVENQF